MKTAPVQPAVITFDADGVPRAGAFDDPYHARAGALGQARHVFLGGNRLPERWRGKARFTVLETGFGLGNNFLATWDAWRGDARRCERLHYVAIEKHPPTRDDLARVHAGSPLRALAEAMHSAAQAQRVHGAALASMSPAVLAYRNLSAARPRLLERLAARAGAGDR